MATVKLPVWEITAHTYRFFWAERGQFWLLAVPAIAVVSLLSSIAEWRAAATAERIDLIGGGALLQTPASVLFLAAISNLAKIWAYVCYSIAWHRSYLVPSEHVTIGSCYLWGARQWQFLWALVKISVVLTLIIIGGILAISLLAGMSTSQMNSEVFQVQAMGPPIIIMFFVAAILIGATYMRLTVLLPAAAIDEGISISRVWALTQGNAFRLLGIAILVSIPMGILLMLVGGILGIAVGWAPEYGPLTSNLIRNLVEQFLSYIYIAIGISALSASYQRLSAANNSD
ncbi:MAG: hypothetical protein VYE18_09440 [Pseudomonadota bacterium]|nr:hypothetical protein [Pseudomonadota bacterium]